MSTPTETAAQPNATTESQVPSSNTGAVANAPVVADETVPREARQPKQPREPPAPSSRLYVSHLPNDSPLKELRAELQELLSGYPNTHVLVRSSHAPRFRKVYAFVTLGSIEEADKAREELEGKKLRDFELHADYARPESERKPRKPRAPAKEDGTPGDDTAKANGTKSKKESGPRQQRPMRPLSKDKVRVKGIPLDASEEEVRELLTGFQITEVRLLSRDEKQRRFNGRLVVLPAQRVAFVTLDDEAAQAQVVETYDGKDYKGVKLRVTAASEPPAKETSESDVAPKPEVEGTS